MPDPITWYLLNRTVADLQTVMEAIDAKMLTHNQDPSAHGQSSEAVYEHRGDTVLDHPDGSVNLKHIVRDHVVSMGTFESLDGWNSHGSNYAGVLGARLKTDDDAPLESAWLYPKNHIGSNLSLDTTKNPFFQTTVFLLTTTDRLIYIVAGDAVIDIARIAFGFKIIDAKIYAYWLEYGNPHTVEISGFNPQYLHTYRVEFNSDVPSIDFYIDGDLKYTATSSLPEEESSILFSYYVERTNASARYLYPVDWLFQQER